MNTLHRVLEKHVRETEMQQIEKVNLDPWRLRHHLMPPVGWLNDPNGLCRYRGEYHVFFQYAPLNVDGGLKFWGHYTSKDLLNWKFIDTVMYADTPFDCHGVYSGSAFVEEDKMHLFYTGNVKKSGDYDYITTGRESNTIYAVCEEGVEVRRKTCVMRNEDYASDCTCHVRDPKVWKEDNMYYMIQGARRQDDVGEVLIFASENLLSWKLVNQVTSEKPFGYMWECPDYFVIDGQQVLITCPQGVETEGEKYQNLYQCGYFPVEGDILGNVTLGTFEELDYGFDFYAPQTFEDEQGRRILIGWAGMPDADYGNPTNKRGWQHCLSIPRELHFIDGRLYQMPVEEMQKLRREEQRESLANGFRAEKEGAYEMNIEMTGEPESFTFTIEDAFDEAGRLTLEYDCETKRVTLELEGELAAGRTKRTVNVENLKTLRILADTSCLEIYLNNGEKVMTTRYYLSNSKSIVSISKMSGELKIWDLNHMNIDYGL